MWSGFGHRIVWYTVMNILEEHFSVSVFIGCEKIEAVFRDQNLSTHQSVYTVP
jgi:hypothetical protein